MRIGIDARWVREPLSGIERYTLCLINALEKIHNDSEYVLFTCSQQESEKLALALHGNERFSFEVCPYGVFSLRGQVQFPRRLRHLHLDIYHSPNFMAPLLLKSVPMVVTIHDLIPLIHPEYVMRSRKVQFYSVYKRIMRWVVDRADAIIVNSNHCKGDVLSRFNVFPDKIRVITEGVEEKWFEPQTSMSPEELLGKYGIQGKVILYVGRREPYKNVSGLIRAFSKLMERASFPCRLVIVGRADPRYPEPQNLVKQLGLEPMVTFTGHVQDEELRCWYRAASIFVLPSLYEGFGLPVLEAFASGLPVVSSSRACLPETVGDAGILFDPQDEDKVTEAMHSALTDEKLRSEMIRNGKRRAREFSWLNTAEQTLKVYDEVCSLR